MTFEQIYLIASAATLCWLGFVWSSTGWLNIIIKTLLVGLSFSGAVLVAKEFFL